MTITGQEDLDGLRRIGGIVAETLAVMAKALEPGMTTRELDGIGRAYLERHGARSAPEADYDFPGATCISVNEEIAHGIPGDRRIMAGDLVNIDVSAELDGYYGDTGASFAVPPVAPRIQRLCADGKKAAWTGLRAVAPGKPIAAIGEAIDRFARKNRYGLVTNLASHGIGRALHEEPGEIPTWHDPSERRRMHEGMVFTIEPFLSLGARYAMEGDDGWTLLSEPRTPVVQYEHTIAVGRNGPVVLTLPRQA